MGIFKKIAKLFKSLLKAIKKILAVLLIVIAVILFVWATICTAGATLAIAGFLITPMTAVLLGVLAVTGAFLVDKDTAKQVTGKIGDALGNVAESVGNITGSVVGGGVKGLLSSPAVWLVGGIGLLWWLSSGSDSTRYKPKSEGKAKPGAVKPGASNLNNNPQKVSTQPVKAKGTNDLSAALLGA